MKVDPLCRRCSKPCKQKRPAIVVSCAKFIPNHPIPEKTTEMTG